MNNESADEPPLSDRYRIRARTKAHASRFNPFGSDDQRRTSSTLSATSTVRQNDQSTVADPVHPNTSNSSSNGVDIEKQEVAQQSGSEVSPPAPPPVDEKREGETSSTISNKGKKVILRAFWNDTRMIIMYNPWINWMLVFVPVGIALGALEKAKGDDSPVSPSVIFAINAVAIIPLAGLLSFATESVASKLGDTIGALMNVTFGNAVELIIFIIALVAKEIRIVQASLLGSILSNLLLILGMSFLFGGLRFREQLYNPTVGQMSACLLSLSVISLLLPTAFHFSFNDASQTQADRAVVKLSRGTSVILLLVYVIYLLFQLKSHAYMYESTPQHLIDEESHPGVLADFMNSSSSSDTSSSSDSDSDTSSSSHTTAKRRIKRAFRRRRKSSASSKDTKDTGSIPSIARTPSSLANHVIDEVPLSTPPAENAQKQPVDMQPVLSGDEADDDGERTRSRRGTQTSFGVKSRDFQIEKDSSTLSIEDKRKKKKRDKKHLKKLQRHEHASQDVEKSEQPPQAGPSTSDNNSWFPPRVEFVDSVVEPTPADSPRKPFALRNLPRPALPKVLSGTVFSSQNAQVLPPPAVSGLRQEHSHGLRRTSSLPDRLNGTATVSRPALTSVPSGVPRSARPLPHLMPIPPQQAEDHEEEEKIHLSRTTAIVLLVISTGLVAACAEFLVDSIDYLVETSGISQAFIGLIILPMVGNAAEHVTAVTVASKNKMDLAIGVALGSSIQIAIFVTPIIVLLGWCLNTDMSLYFSLFETVSLFASAFIVNYLMIDGRSNYLEGALLIASYVIIAVAAYFYPSCENLSGAAGPSDSTGSC